MAQATRPRALLRVLGAEALGAAMALALALAALRHVLATDRVRLLWYDGDSVLLPLVERSLRLGQSFEWAMSPTLFFFPEIPVYLACAALTSTPQQALALNGLLVVVAVYVLVRAVAAQVMPEAPRAVRVAVAVGALGVVTLLVLTESSGTASSLELASLLLTTTYYYGAVLAMLGTAALALRVVRTASLPVPRTSWVALAVTTLVAASSTASDPLYVPWSAAPVIVTVGLLALARRVPWRVVWGLGVALAGGSALGYLLRIPLAPFVSLDPSTYIHPGGAGTTLSYFAALTDERAGAGLGEVELVLLLVLFLASLGGTVWAWRVRSSRTVLVASALGMVTVVAVSVGVVLAGSSTPRYLEPIVTAPLIGLVAVAELARTAIRRTRLHTAGRGLRLIAVAATVALLAVGGAVAPSTVEAVVTASYAPASCLDRWVGGRGVVGVGQFWTVRPLAAYGDEGVRLLQVRDDFTTYPWLVDLAAYRDARPTYVVIGSQDVWTTPVQDALGDPSAIVHCPGYDIYDYAGTPGAATLRHDVVSTAQEFIEERGFGG
ncbi:hypothetical protein [Curtobacterium sp. MCBD17_003]|uniref:hypothetical protein n=1 Tax=Curtobacterium sp. MCBD17_003 TaxID=2175667 RepID=UPI000DA7243D|nr:hypothetical protein [Curtobacterium sp. MCBD17_003]WIE55140.1 hypothetical protein DEI88_002725 [Curtobacterium sp. MCBD17_003]